MDNAKNSAADVMNQSYAASGERRSGKTQKSRLRAFCPGLEGEAASFSGRLSPQVLSACSCR